LQNTSEKWTKNGLGFKMTNKEIPSKQGDHRVSEKIAKIQFFVKSIIFTSTSVGNYQKLSKVNKSPTGKNAHYGHYAP
jgi:hypothetical protein